MKTLIWWRLRKHWNAGITNFAWRKHQLRTNTSSIKKDVHKVKFWRYSSILAWEEISTLSRNTLSSIKNKFRSVQKLFRAEGFTYVPGTDEIIYVLINRLQGSKIFRRPLSANGRGNLFIRLKDESALCIEHNAENYLVTLSETIMPRTKSRKPSTHKIELMVRIFDEIGCLTKPTCSYRKDSIMPYLLDRIKTCQ